MKKKSLIPKLNKTETGNIVSVISNHLILLALVIYLAGFSSCTKKDDCDGGTCPDACSTNPCGNPDLCPGMCAGNDNSEITKNDLVAEGHVTETDKGMTVDGKLTIKVNDNDNVVLDSADLTVMYNDDGTVNNISGKALAPSPKDYFEFSKPLKADVGYYSGKYLNENWDLDITLHNERYYFAYMFSVNLELRVGANSDPNATKPISIKPPLGGHITYIVDYTDPFYYFSGGLDIIGNSGMAQSFQGLIPYVPIQPVDKIVSFDGKSFRSGDFSIFKVIDVSGVMVQNKDFNVELTDKNPFPLTFTAGYGAGVNGSFDLSLPIKGFISFNIPMGEASAAVVAEAGTNGVTAQAFLNGLAKPDNSWWPGFVPVKPGGQIRLSGYVQQQGQFDLSLSGEFEINTPTSKNKIAGITRATNEAFALAGEVTANNQKWEAGIEFKKDQTTLTATPPKELLDNISNLVNANIDSGFAKADSAYAQLQRATADYEFELSLRGLRSTLPTVITEAKKQIAAGITAGIKSGRDQANSILSDKGLALCSDNISSVVNDVASPYYAALNRLLNAVNNTMDNDQTRTEIAGALRDLAKLDQIDKTLSVTITAGNKAVVVLGKTIVPKCTTTSNFKRSVNVKATVLTNDQVAKLNEAADNVKYIAETSSIMVKAQQVFDQAPSKDDLDKLKEDIRSGTKKIPAIGSVGFVYTHSNKSYSFFMVMDGQKKDVSEFNVFDGNSLAGMVTKGL